MQRSKPCKWCEDKQPNHYPFQCFKNPKRTKIKKAGDPKTIKRLAQRGKVSYMMSRVRQAWFIDNPPNPFGYYICYLCGKWLAPIEVELDHIKSRSRYPELRYEITNLAPACHSCNLAKGSKDISEFKKELDL